MSDPTSSPEDSGLISNADADAKDDALVVADAARPPKRKRGLTEEKPSGVTESVTHVDLPDGCVTFCTGTREVTIDAVTASHLRNNNLLRNLKIIDKGYLRSGFTVLHRVVGLHFCESRDKVKERFPEHFASNPNDTTVIMHLDNDKMNCCRNNLMHGPQTLNLLMKKSHPRRLKSGKFGGAVQVGGKTTHTKSLISVEETKHATDILKLQMIHPEFREIIFKYAMHKPSGFLQYYVSVDTLLARAIFYKKELRKPQKLRVSRNTYGAFQTLEAAASMLTVEEMKVINGIFQKEGAKPFDAKIDAVILYVGAQQKRIVTLLEYDFYREHLHLAKPVMHVNTSGYIQIRLGNRSHQLHNVVLGRNIGQKSIDGLEGGHGYGKQLDNRKRCLRAQTPIENASERGDKATAGVFENKFGSFDVTICNFWPGIQAYLGRFTTATEASAVYWFARENKAALVEKLETTLHSKRKVELRKLCKAQSLV